MNLLLETYEYIRPGGLLMLPLIITSSWMWVLIVERLIYFRKICFSQTCVNEALEILSGKSGISDLKGLLSIIMSEFVKIKTGNRFLDKEILRHCVMKERFHIRRYLSVISILAAIAPFLGLLGTVTGMVTTFDVIAVFGTGNAKAMAGGISEALITTQTGLLIAIPGLFMSSFLNRRASVIEATLDNFYITIQRHL